MMKVEPVDGLGHRRAAGMPDRRDRRRLIHQRHEMAAEQIAQHILHVGHHEGGDLSPGEGHHPGVWLHSESSSSVSGEQ
jgi:hypothetical protein